jgi:hypothetical protein
MDATATTETSQDKSDAHSEEQISCNLKSWMRMQSQISILSLRISAMMLSYHLDCDDVDHTGHESNCRSMQRSTLDHCHTLLVNILRIGSYKLHHPKYRRIMAYQSDGNQCTRTIFHPHRIRANES